MQLNITAKNLELFDIKAVTTKTENRKVVLTNQRMQGPEKIAIGKTVFKRIRNGNEFYRDGYQIWHRAKKFGYLLANSRHKKRIQIDNFNLQVYNNKLYERGWLDDLQTIMHEASMEYKSFTRLDIAIDGGEYNDVWKQWIDKKLDKVGRAEVTSYQDNKRGIKGYKVGSRKSKKQITCYNKSRELKISNKWYIEKYWKRNNLDFSEDVPVQRCELMLRNEEGKKFRDIDWTRFDDSEHLASIMRVNLEKFYEWVIPSREKNISRKERYNPIDWNELFPSDYLEKDSTRSTDEIWGAKQCSKYNAKIFFLTGNRLWLNMAYEVAANADILRWFNSMLPEWEEDIKHRKAMGDIPDWQSSFKSYDNNEQLEFFDKLEFQIKHNDEFQ